MTKTEAKLRKCEADLKRWRTRLKRALNTVDKLERQRQRLDREELRERLMAEHKPIYDDTRNVTGGFDEKAGAAPGTEAAPAQVPPREDDGLDIPENLKRNRQLQTLPDPRTKEKKAERRAVEREKREANLRGKTRKWPLTGKAAIDAIRAGK